MSARSNNNSAASSPRHLNASITDDSTSTSAAATSNPSSRAASAGGTRAKAQFLAKQEAVARTKEKIAAKQAAEKAAKKAAIQAANGITPSTSSAATAPSSRDLDAEAIALRKKMIIEQEMALAAEKEAVKKQTVNASLAALKAKKEKAATSTTTTTSSAAKKKAAEEAERAHVQAEAEAAAAAAYAAAQVAEEQRLLQLQQEQQRLAEEEEAERIAAEEEAARIAAEEEFAEAERVRLEQEEAEAAAAAQAAIEAEEQRQREAAAQAAAAARLRAEQAEAAALAARAAATALELKKQQERLDQEEKARAAKLAQAKALALERKKKQQAEAAAEVERIRRQREEEEAAAAAEEARLFAQEEAAAAVRRRAQEQEDAEVAEAVTLAAERARFDEEQALEAEAQAEREFHDRLKSNQLESERLAHKKRLQLEQMRKLKQQQQQEIESSRSVASEKSNQQQQDLKQNLSPSSRRSTAPAPHISSSPAIPSSILAAAAAAAAVSAPDPMAVDASALAYAQARREELREEARKKRRELEEALAAERERQQREAEEMAQQEEEEAELEDSEQPDEHSFAESATGDELPVDDEMQDGDDPQPDEEDDEGGFDVVRASKIGGFTSPQHPAPSSGRAHHVTEEKESSFRQQQSNIARQQSAPFNRTMKKSPSTAGVESPLRQSLSRSPSQPKPTASSFVQPSLSDFGRMDRPLTAPHRNFSTGNAAMPSFPASHHAAASNLQQNNPLRHSIAPGAGHNNSFNSYKNPQSDAWMEENSSDVVLASELARLQALQDELSMQNMKVRMLKQKAASKDQEKLIKKRITGIVGTTPRPAGQKLQSRNAAGEGGRDQPAGVSLNTAADLSPSAPAPAQSPPFKPNPDAHLGDTLTKAISSASKQARLLHEEVENEMGGVAVVPTVKSSGKNTPRSVLRQPKTTAAAVLMDPQHQHADLSGTHSFPAQRDSKGKSNNSSKASSRQSELKARFDAAEDNDDDFQPSAVQFSTSSILRKEGKPFVSQQPPPPSAALYPQQESELDETEEDESPFEPQSHTEEEEEEEDQEAEESLSKKFEAAPPTVTMGKQAFARQAQARAPVQNPAASQIGRKTVNVVRAHEQEDDDDDEEPLDTTAPTQKLFTHAQPPTAVGANRSSAAAAAATLRAEKRQTAPANVGVALAHKPQPPQPSAIPTYAQYNPNAADNDSPRSTVSSASTSSSSHPRKKWAKEAALLHSPVIAQTVQDSMALNRSVFIQHPAVKEIVALEAHQRQQHQQQQPQSQPQRGAAVASPAFASPPPVPKSSKPIDSQATPPGIATAVQQAAAAVNAKVPHAPVVPKHAGPVRSAAVAAAAVANLPTQKVTQPVVPPIRSGQYNDPSLPIQLGPHSHRSLFSTASNNPHHPHRPASPAATESDNLSVFERHAYSESPQRAGNSAITNASSPTHSVKSTASAWSATLSLSPSVNSAGVALDPENVHLSAEELLELERRQRRKIAELKEREAKARAKKEMRKQQEEAAATANAVAAGVDFSSPAEQFHRRVSSGGHHSSPQGIPAPGLYSANAGLNGKAAATKPSSTVAPAVALSATSSQPGDVKAPAGTTAAAAAVAKKKVNILKQPENYGQRFEMQQQQQQQGVVSREKGGIQAVPRSNSALSTASGGASAAASTAAATTGPSLDELDEELKQMQEEEEMEQAQQALAPASKKTRPGAVVAPLSKPSNRQLLLNAIQHVCLAGATMSAMRNAVVAELKASPGEHFLILLKQERALTFKALYLCNLDTQQAMKLFGEGPELIDSTMIQTYFKYDSAAKQFKEIPAERLTPTSAAVVLIPTLQRKARSIKK